MTEDLYLFIALSLALNAFAIIGIQLYLMFVVIPKAYKYDHADYERLVVFLAELNPLTIFDSISRYFVPLYGVFMSSYLIYLLHLNDDTKGWKLSSKFKYAERELQKFRIFKRKNKWKKYYYH